MRFWTTEKSEYRGKVGINEIKKMTSSALLGFNEGILVEMKRE